MAIHHAASGELIDVRPLGDKLAGTISTTLYKSEHLEVFRLILQAGKSMPSHQVAGEVTLQCLEGCVEVEIEGVRQPMRAGDFMCIAGGAVHALTAMENSSMLVSILLRRE